MLGAFLTKMKGNTPTTKVMKKLMVSAASALSLPFIRETPTDSSINRASTRRAMPTFRDITLRFITPVSDILDAALQRAVFLREFHYPGI